MTRCGVSKSCALLITLIGFILNSILATEFWTISSTLVWQPEFQWKFLDDIWLVDGVQVTLGLLFAYFGAFASVCAIGFAGVIKGEASLVRVYRKYSVVDLVFCFASAIVGICSAFYASSVARESVCEMLFRQPELMRKLKITGLGLENCERLVDRAVMASVVIIFTSGIIKVHFLLAITHYYNYMSRHENWRVSSKSSHYSSEPLCQISPQDCIITLTVSTTDFLSGDIRHTTKDSI